jgi:hypothetical protein
VVGRFLAVCGWLAWQVRRPFGRRLSSGRFAAVPTVVVGVLLLVAAAVPLVVPQLDPQPEDVTVQQLFDHAVSEPAGWVRLRGRLVPLAASPTGEPGEVALLVDASEPLRAVVVRASTPLEATDDATVTGHVVPATVDAEQAVQDLPIEATVAGTPPRVVPDAIVALDAVPKPARQVWWPLAIVPGVLGILLLVGARAGYPVFRRTSEIAVLVAPLALGERVPAAFGGRIGPVIRSLADPGGVLLLLRRGPGGDLLTAQPLPDDGSVAPAPVTIGGGWTTGRIGEVHALTETVPALVLRSELVDATLLFARSSERDRVAARVTLER